MFYRFSILLICTFFAVLPAIDADGWQYAVDAGKIEGQNTKFRLWMPEKVTQVRAAFLFVPHGSYGDYSKSTHLRNLASELECAIILSDKELCGPNDNKDRVLDALRALAVASGRPEIANIPLFVFGHSNSTHTMGTFAHQVPERIIAWVATKSANGRQFEYPELARIPGMVVCGELDHSYFQDQLATVKRMRKEHHALVHILIEADGPHWPTKPTFEIQAAFLRQAFYRRVPYHADARIEPPTLLTIDEKSGWLGQNLDGVRVLTVDGEQRTWSWDRPVTVKSHLAIAPFADYPGDPAEASWFPGPQYAHAWQLYCETLSTEGASAVSSALIQAWRTSREPDNDDDLRSDLLPDLAKKLANTSSYERPLKELRKIVADNEKSPEGTEATRLITRIETRANECLEQAQRLETTHMPTAVSAYQQLEKRYAGTAASEAAQERLRSKIFKQQIADWKLLAQMRQLNAELTTAGGKTVEDASFAQANAAAFKELRAIAAKLIKGSNGSAAAVEAQALLERYRIPLP